MTKNIEACRFPCIAAVSFASKDGGILGTATIERRAEGVLQIETSETVGKISAIWKMLESK